MIKLYAGVAVAAQHICKSLAPVDLIAIMLLRQPLRGLVHSSCYVVFMLIPTPLLSSSPSFAFNVFLGFLFVNMLTFSFKCHYG